MADTLHLSLRGRTWWYIRKIPPALRPAMRLPHTGKAMFRHNLQTSDLAIALRKRPALNAAVEAEITAAKKRAKGDANPDVTARADDLWRWVQHGGHVDDAEGSECRREANKRLIKLLAEATRNGGVAGGRSNCCPRRGILERFW